MKQWDELREHRYEKAVTRFCALGLFAFVVIMCVVVR
jgi:hypothetical protein